MGVPDYQGTPAGLAEVVSLTPQRNPDYLLPHLDGASRKHPTDIGRPEVAVRATFIKLGRATSDVYIRQPLEV